MTPSKVDILADIQSLGPEVTRAIYRLKGKFSERQVEKHFGNFSSAVKAANLESDLMSTRTDIPSLSETVEVSGDRQSFTLPKTRIDTLAKLIEHFQIDESIWKVERFIANKWEMGTAVGKDEDKYIVVEPLFQVKATFIRQPDVEAAKKEIARLKDSAKAMALVPKPVIRSDRQTGNMLEISLNDAHFGKLAWSRETKGPDYDTRIAQRLFLESVEHLLDRAKGYSFDQILFVVGNDLIHSDDTQGRTTKGTFVDCDTRYYKTFEIVRETITLCIERFRKIAPVVVKMVQGNHDELSVWHLGDSLTALFRNYDDVTIDNEPTYRKYHQWGKCGLLLTHGDKGKRADFPLLFATEEPEIFGTSKFREVHTGHLHQTRTEEFHGVRVRIIPSLSAADSWHSENGFTGQQRVAEAYLFNKEAGLLATFFHNADS